MDRMWLPEKLALLLEFDRFMVEPGCGIAVFKLIPPSVCRLCQYAIQNIATVLCWKYAWALTSLGLRTLHKPVSWDMVVDTSK